MNERMHAVVAQRTLSSPSLEKICRMAIEHRTDAVYLVERCTQLNVTSAGTFSCCTNLLYVCSAVSRRLERHERAEHKLPEIGTQIRYRTLCGSTDVMTAAVKCAAGWLHGFLFIDVYD